MSTKEDDWHRLLFRPDITSTDEDLEERHTKMCTCKNFDVQGRTSLCTVTLDQTCLISSNILRNILLAVFDSSEPEKKNFRIPHWIRFDIIPRTVIFVECSDHPNSETFPLCETHHFRYKYVSESIFEDLFLTPIRSTDVIKRSKSHRNIKSIHRLREKRREEEEDVIRRIIRDGVFDEESCQVPVSFNHDPQFFELTAYQRRLLGIYISTDDDIPIDFMKPRYCHHEHPPPKTHQYAEIPNNYLVSLDCEMVRTTHGFSIARISIVDIPTNKVLYDELVRPVDQITSYMTQYSGITKRKLEEINKTLDEARHEILENVIFNDTFVVGHALHNDLQLLRIAPRHVIDISILYPKHCVENTCAFKVCIEGKKRISTTLLSAEAKSLGIEGQERSASRAEIKRGFQLKLLSFWFLGRHIQSRGSHGTREDIGHDSVEDAHACSDLFRLKMFYGKDFGIDALLYYASGEVVSSINEAVSGSISFDMRAVISRMRNTKVVDTKYGCRGYREAFHYKDKIRQINHPKFLLEHLTRVGVRFLWYMNQHKEDNGEMDSLPHESQISSLRNLREYLKKEDKQFVYLNLAKPPSDWNIIKLGNYLHDECLEANPKAPSPLVVMVTKQTYLSSSSILFH